MTLAGKQKVLAWGEHVTLLVTPLSKGEIVTLLRFLSFIY